MAAPSPITDFPPTPFSRPAWCQINLEALRHNARVLSRSTPLLAVIKANAYGHGAVEVARALSALGESVPMLAVASVDEGRALRHAGIETPILLLSGILPEECAAVIESRLTPTISTLAVADALDAAAAQADTRARAHWKIDTGMGRLGTAPTAAAQVWRALQEYSRVEIKGVYTHFACADEIDNPLTLQQLRLFQGVLVECGITSQQYSIHAANSAATLVFPQAHFSRVRCGLALYGVSPLETTPPEFRLQPVMSLKARVVEIREIAQGRTVSYGATWTAARDSRLALVPLGYADGYPRALSNRGEVLVRGQRCPVAGRVTMDQILVDVSSLSPPVQPGEIVVAWGEAESGEVLHIEEAARKADTIPYELLTRVAARVPRVYLN